MTETHFEVVDGWISHRVSSSGCWICTSCWWWLALSDEIWNELVKRSQWPCIDSQLVLTQRR